jgi:ankyrin repeat protein
VNRPSPKPSGRLGALDLIRLLLDRRADPNQALKTPLLMRQHNFGDASLGAGATPLMRAAKVSDAALMRLLLEKGADPNARMKNQTTALMVAASRPLRNGPPEKATNEAIALLIDRGADVNAANDTGETALHVAVGRGDAVVRFLVEKGARLDATDKYNRTPLDVAMGAPGRPGRGGAPAERGPVRESTAVLLRQLMGLPPAPAQPTPSPSAGAEPAAP